MKIKNRQKNLKKIVAISIASFIVLAGTYGTFAFFNQWWPFVEDIHREPINYNPPTSEQQKAGEQASEEAKKGEETSNQAAPSDVGSNTTNVTITSLNQNESTLQIRTFINTIDPGTCTATLSRDSHSSIEKTAETQSLANGSTCRGFDIPTEGMAKGEWVLTIQYKSSNNNIQGSVEENVTIH